MSNENFKKVTNANKFFSKQSPSSRNKRERESIDTSDSFTKKTCTIVSPLKSPTMSEFAELKAYMESAFKNAETKQEEFRKEMKLSLESLTKGIQSQLDAFNNRLATVEDTHASQNQSLQREISQIQSQSNYNTNKIEQQLLENDMIARGLPSMYATKLDEMTAIINDKLKSNLSNLTVQSIRALNPQQHQHTCTYFFKFKSRSFKEDFMQSVNDFRKKDIIALEDIFEIYKNTNHAGKLISFRNSLTKQTKLLLDTAAAAKRAGKIEHAWERTGSIFMRKRQGERAVEALSVDHIHQFASE